MLELNASDDRYTTLLLNTFSRAARHMISPADIIDQHGSQALTMNQQLLDSLCLMYDPLHLVDQAERNKPGKETRLGVCGNCRGIDVVRNKIKMFAQKKATLPPGRHKIVILDEADRYVDSSSRTSLLRGNTSRSVCAQAVSNVGPYPLTVPVMH